MLGQSFARWLPRQVLIASNLLLFVLNIGWFLVDARIGRFYWFNLVIGLANLFQMLRLTRQEPKPSHPSDEAPSGI